MVGTTSSSPNSFRAPRSINFKISKYFRIFPFFRLPLTYIEISSINHEFFGKISEILKLMDLRAHKELGELLVVPTIHKYYFLMMKTIFKPLEMVSKSLARFFDQFSNGPLHVPSCVSPPPEGICSKIWPEVKKYMNWSQRWDKIWTCGFLFCEGEYWKLTKKIVRIPEPFRKCV